jgi:N-hydroxyarylamine O-acetyltransferase
MDLAAYLDRIRFTGTVQPDFATLRALHLAHQRVVPFENLDVQLRRPLGIGVEAAYEKIVRRRRGGWCYEMNGVMGWALREIGFDVTRISAGVMRDHPDDVDWGNHLCLLVRLDQPYLVDVGFGGSLSEPIPLQAAAREDRPYRIALSRINGDHWRFTEDTHDAPFTFDFHAAPADEALFARRCKYLQSDPASPFIQNLVVQRRAGDTHFSLRGRVLTTLRWRESEKRLLASADELVATLQERFDLDVPEAATLWPAVCARHEVVFGHR